ncbi:MAG: hypothetical protein JSV91_11545 [Phycisphaerales bacterium]|nr:MAG: hypothetical protein JSV91_11545 [Phycisphaerales bacterium]
MNALTAILNPASAVQLPTAARDDQHVRSGPAVPPVSGEPVITPHQENHLAESGPPTLTEKAEITIDGLIEAWGTDNPRYDLNGDGTVNIDDLFALLGKMAEEMHEPEGKPEAFTDLVDGPQTPPPSSEPADTPVVSDTPAATPSLESGDVATESSEVPQSESQPPLTIDNLLDAWGTDNPHYDLNGDGTVDIDDLFALLGQMAQENRRNGEVPPPVGPPENLPRVARDSNPRALADALIEKLSDIGFTENPPTNLRSLIDMMDLGRRFKAELMQHMATFYRQGLGVDHLG